MATIFSSDDPFFGDANQSSRGEQGTDRMTGDSVKLGHRSGLDFPSLNVIMSTSPSNAHALLRRKLVVGADFRKINKYGKGQSRKIWCSDDLVLLFWGKKRGKCARSNERHRYDRSARTAPSGNHNRLGCQAAAP